MRFVDDLLERPLLLLGGLFGLLVLLILWGSVNSRWPKVAEAMGVVYMIATFVVVIVVINQS